MIWDGQMEVECIKSFMYLKWDHKCIKHIRDDWKRFMFFFFKVIIECIKEINV